MEQITPHIFHSCSGISACFTLKNQSTVNTGGEIPGLNLGLNTTVPEQEIDENYQTLLNSLKLDSARLAIARQIHGSRVNVVAEGGVYPDTDGLITDVTGIILGIQVADCAAILLADPEQRVVAALHAGWRGALDGIVPGAVEKLISGFRVSPENLRAYISPAICQRYFEVGEEVSSQFPGEFVDSRSYKKPHVDLKGFIRHQLLEAGVSENNVQAAPGCTWRDGEQFYSYRREGNRSGRMLAMIWLHGQVAGNR